MSKLIQKAGFLNPKRAGRYMNYIATRDGVELLDENADSIYMRYIATRPRAEKHGEHGLFGAEDAVDLEKTLGELKAVYVQKDIAYKDVTGAARETMRRIVDRLESVKNPPESIQKKMMELVLELRTITGKSSMDISESRSRIWWIPSWMNWKKCRRLLRIMPSGTTCAIRWRATTKANRDNTIHSHSRKNSEPSRTQSFRKRSVCAFNTKNLLRRLLQIRCL